MVTVESPFPQHARPRVWTWIGDSRRFVADDFAPATLDDFIEFWERREHAGEQNWAVYRDGELGGLITSARFNPVLADFHALFKKSFWGHGLGVEAFRLVLSEIFGAGVQKVSSACFSDNHAVLGLVAKVGFDREGLLKRNTMRDGKLVDQVMVGLTKERWDQLGQKTEMAEAS